MDEFIELETYLRRIPAIESSMRACTFGKGRFDNGNWWVKFSIDIDHPIAWQVIQELGNVLNYLSVKERLPTVFMPVSPPSYLNGGPREFLAWVIESTSHEFTPNLCSEWLQGRLPQPVEDLSQWRFRDQAEEARSSEDGLDSTDRQLPKLEDCEAVGQKHKWFNIDDVSSGCYNCRVVRAGQLWRRSGRNS
jgi:hypothetical protein